MGQPRNVYGQGLTSRNVRFDVRPAYYTPPETYIDYRPQRRHVDLPPYTKGGVSSTNTQLGPAVGSVSSDQLYHPRAYQTFLRPLDSFGDGTRRSGAPEYPSCFGDTPYDPQASRKVPENEELIEKLLLEWTPLATENKSPDLEDGKTDPNK